MFRHLVSAALCATKSEDAIMVLDVIQHVGKSTPISKDDSISFYKMFVELNKRFRNCDAFLSVLDLTANIVSDPRSEPTSSGASTSTANISSTQSIQEINLDMFSTMPIDLPCNGPTNVTPCEYESAFAPMELSNTGPMNITTHEHPSVVAPLDFEPLVAPMNIPSNVIDNGLESNLTPMDQQSTIINGHEREATPYPMDLQPLNVTAHECESAFSQRMRSVSLTNNNSTSLDLPRFLSESCNLFKALFSNDPERRFYKIYASLKANFIKCSNDTQIEDIFYVNTNAAVLSVNSDLAQFFIVSIAHPIMTNMSECQERGSGWALLKIDELRVNIMDYSPLSGSRKMSLPKPMLSTKSIINVDNNDSQCFKWAILAGLHHNNDHNASRVSLYRRYENSLDFDSINFPVATTDFEKFEMQNSVSINVFTYELKRKDAYEIMPLYLSKQKKRDHVNLLLAQEELGAVSSDTTELNNKIEIRNHYFTIKNLSRLVCSQIKKTNEKKYMCDRCLVFFYTRVKLDIHTELCRSVEMCKIELPSEEDKILEFNNFQYSLVKRYVIYADIESFLEPITQIDTDSSSSSFPNNIPSSIGYFLKDRLNPTKSYFKSNRGLNCMEWFCEELEQIANRLQLQIVSPQYPCHLTASEKVAFQNSNVCHICTKPFVDELNYKVKDHCHSTGVFRGAAHNNCNLQYKDTTIVPVVFHNLSNYDAHLIILKINSLIKGPIQLFPNNNESYISFTKTVVQPNVQYKNQIKFRFIDSFRFMTSSLDKLSSYLNDDKKQNLKYAMSAYSTKQVQLAYRKGVFPYDYVDSWLKYDDNILPTQEQFYSKLTDSNITNEDYNHAKRVWQAFNIRTLGDYSDLHLKIDVLLLADVFENFRDTCHDIFKLDPAHYLTAPALSWDAMLKYTKVKIELLTDIDMILFVEKGLRGGISHCSHRYAKANNRYMGEDFDASKPIEYLIYLDANNLYGRAMMECLPLSGFEWLNDTNLDVCAIPNDSPEGYFLEVDLEYPPAIHNNHSDYPMCAEHRIPPGASLPKLLLTLHDKNNYIIHYRALKQAIKYGLILKKIHKILKFKQSPWMEPYIRFNTEQRMLSGNEFEKNFYKLLNDAVFGKTMENARRCREIKLVSTWGGCSGAKKYVSSPYFKSNTVFSESCAAIEMYKSKCFLNNPISIGMAILDLSKCLMYDFHYGHMKETFASDVQLLYTDTDSLIYKISNFDIYESIKINHRLYDTGGFAANNPYGIIQKNPKLPGLMKDENNGAIMTEFVGLGSKMYSFRVKNYVVSKNLAFDEYLNCIYNNSSIVRNQNTIRSKLHFVFTQQQRKIALLAQERFITKNLVNTLPWGHLNILLHIQKEEPEDDEEEEFAL